MSLSLTDDQKMIRDEALRFLGERASREALRRHIDAGGGFHAALWAEMAGELGWAAMSLPEDLGGIGLGFSELVILAEAAGRALAPVPFWSTSCLATPLLMALGGEGAEALLAEIALGKAVVLALSQLGEIAPEVSALATREGEGYRLNGRFDQLIDLAAAETLLVPAKIDGALALFALCPDQGARQEHVTMDLTRPMGSILLDNLLLPATARLDQDGLSQAALDHALEVATLGLAAEQIGLAEGLMEMTLDYIKERVQFGRLIASFQAIKHRCALLQVDLAEARSLLYGTAAGLASAPVAKRQLELSSLKALADQLALKAAREAIQMHGGVAMTWEYDPHFWMKRVQVNATLLGQADEHFERVAALYMSGEEG